MYNDVITYSRRTLIRFLICLLVLVISNSSLASKPENTRLSPEKNLAEKLLSHVSILAHDSLEGRGIGTAGLDKAADYIRSQFISNGLDPLFDGDYFQTFGLSWGVIAQNCSFISLNDDTLYSTLDIIPQGFSSSGKIKSPVIFAGYGITAPEYEYDDYEEIDARGKIVIVMSGEPANDNPGSKFSGTDITQYAVVRGKLQNAKIHGAVGFIHINMETDSQEKEILTAPRTNEPYRDSGILAINCTQSGLRRLFPRFNLQKAGRSIDINQSPRSMPVSQDSLTMNVDLLKNEIEVKNVAACLPGNEEILIIGAHYDHLGYGQEGSTEPGVRAIHNGADDNASGVSLLLELARNLKTNQPGPTLWFIAFTGEEVGLAGSAYLASNPPSPLSRVKFMLNLDMVGRMQDNKLLVLGINSAEEFKSLISGIDLNKVLSVSMSGDGYGPSDQTSFYSKGIPVLHLLTNAHEDYHSPRDDVDKINIQGMKYVFEYATQIVELISPEVVKLTLVEKAQPDQMAHSRDKSRPRLGTIPDFAQADSIRGVLLQGVRSNSPADKAGIQKGDILSGMDDIVIDNIYDFVYALRNKKAGDKVKIYFIRSGEKMETEATLEKPLANGAGHPGSSRGHSNN